MLTKLVNIFNSLSGREELERDLKRKAIEKGSRNKKVKYFSETYTVNACGYEVKAGWLLTIITTNVFVDKCN